MPTAGGSRPLLNAGANCSAGDWANVGAEASLGLLAEANLNRGRPGAGCGSPDQSRRVDPPLYRR
jgi:hypothetical protein